MESLQVRYTLSKRLSILLLLSYSFILKSQIPNLIVVKPDYGNNSMILNWSAAPGVVQEYQVRRKADAGAFEAWKTAGVNTTYTDSPITPGVLYTYEVRVKIGGVWADTSRQRANKLIKIWPVADGADITTTNRNVLNGFNQAIKAGGSNYLHEGVDMHGKISVANDYVKCPVGGVIMHAGPDGSGSAGNTYVSIEFITNGVARYVLLNHLMNLPPSLTASAVGTSIKPGDTIGQVLSGFFGNNECSHTHFQYYTGNNNWVPTGLDPFSFFSDNADRDPYNNTPTFSDSNGDGEVLRFKKKYTGSAYFQTNKPVYTETDIVVEAFDNKSSGGFNTAPKKIGYFIEKQEDASWVAAVKSSGTPYLLIDSEHGYYNSNSSTPNPFINFSLHDRGPGLKSIAPTTPATYVWEQWFTYVVTNTKGTDGKVANIDTSQCWATDAKNTVTEDNGFKVGYDKAQINEEAKFEDGNYRVSTTMSDWVNTATNQQKEVIVDNFLPYVQKVEMNSDGDVYEAHWSWSGGTLTFSPNSKSGAVKCNKDLVIKVTTSEPMKEVTLSISKIGFSNTTASAEANSKKKVWKFTVPGSSINNAHMGDKLVLSIKGKDLADNEMWGFASKAAVAAANVPKHKDDGTWTVTPPTREDTLHLFQIKKPKFETTATDVSCKASADGTATVTVTAGNAPYKYTWSNGQSNATATSLAPGSYQVIVADANGCDSIGNVSVGKKSCPPDPFTIPVVAGGDPNDITGPAGYGEPKWVSVNDVLPYTIRFENDPKIATSAVNKVTVKHPIDKMASMFTFQLGVITFRGITVDVPPNSSHFYKRLNLKDSMGILLDITAGIDVTKNQAFWIFQAFDPQTGLPNINPDLGFLLVNDSIHHMGEGSVNFSIKPKITAQTKDSIKAYANIVFDDNEIIRTNLAYNTIDAQTPVSHIASAQQTNPGNVQILIKGNDDTGGCGIGQYKLFMAQNNQPYTMLPNQGTDSLYNVSVLNGYTYKFMSIASDNVNNTEETKLQPDTVIEIKPQNFFISPHSQTQLCANSTLTVQWNNTSDILSIDLELTADSGKTYIPVANHIKVSDTIFSLRLPAGLIANKQYMIRAINNATHLPFANSEYFFIKNNILVNAGSDQFLCKGDSVQLGGTPTASMGIVPYHYQWKPSLLLSSATAANPKVSGGGEYIVSVSDSLGCSNSDTVIVSTVDLPNVYLFGLDTSYFTNSNSDTLTAIPAGGVYSGAGMNQEVFSPALAGNGYHTIKYTYTDNNGCRNSASLTTHVIDSPFSSISGILSYDNTSNTPLNHSTALLTKNAGGTDSSTTNQNGAFVINNVQNGDYTLSAKTSISWGGVNATDALLVKKYAIGAISLSALRKRAADVNLSSSINATDALSISKRTIGLISSFPAGDWMFEKDSLTVSGTNISDDLKGVCVGDVNGSYVPASNKTLNMSLISDGSIAIHSSQDFYLPIKTKNNLNLGAITLGIAYPKEIFTIKAVSSKANGLLYNIDNDGNVKMAWSDPVPVQFAAGDTLVLLKCTTTGINTGSFNLSLLTGSELADPLANVINGAVLTAPVIEYGTTTSISNPTTVSANALNQNRPNPFNKITEIDYQLLEDGMVSLKVYNMLGILVANLVEAQQSKGKHTVKFDCTDLAAGIYTYQLNVTGENINFKDSRLMSITK